MRSQKSAQKEGRIQIRPISRGGRMKVLTSGVKENEKRGAKGKKLSTTGKVDHTLSAGAR